MRRMKGELHPIKPACEADFHTLCVFSCISDDSSFEGNYVFSGVATSRDSNGNTL